MIKGSFKDCNSKMSTSIQKSNRQKKLLKSCIRCRKHKTKCDSYLKSPGPCSNCMKKNHVCKIEFISPPKRFDNLKNLNNNLVDINAKINEMLEFYETMRRTLDITEVKSFQEFKVENSLNFMSSDNSDYVSDYNSDYYNDENDESPPPICIRDSSLLKLSNSKFVNISISSTSIKINDFEHDILEATTLTNQHYSNLFNLFEVLSLSHNTYDAVLVSDDEDLLTPVEAFKENKLLFSIVSISSKKNISEVQVQLINQFLKDYVDSYYKIIQKEKLSLDNINSMSTEIQNTQNLTETQVFGKFELCNFLNLKFFNNDKFLIKLIKALIIKFFISQNETDDCKFLITKLVKIIELKLNLNRKNFNFEKNLSTNWKLLLRFIIDYYYSISNVHLSEIFKIHQFKEDENLQNFLINYKVEKTHIFQNLNRLSFNCPDLKDYLNSQSSIPTRVSSPISDSPRRSVEYEASSVTNTTIPEDAPNVLEAPVKECAPVFSSRGATTSSVSKIKDNSSEPGKTLENGIRTQEGKKSEADYEVILDNLIDWQKDSADEVLMKINQLIKN